jgi:O-antigen/teichoic acid export membrane protein
MLVYAPLALAHSKLRTLEALGVFWLGGLVVATVLTVAVTRHWRWAAALRQAPRGRLPLPHRHGSIALYLNDAANAAFQYVDRYIIGIFLSPAALGVYVLFWSITNALNNLIATALVPARRRLLQVNDLAPMDFDGELRRITVGVTLVTVALGVLAAGFVYMVAPHLGRPEIMPYLPLMFLFSTALAARTVYEAQGIAFYARRRDDLTLYSALIILVLSLGLNFGFDPYFGIAGASVALVASYSVGIIARGLIIARGFKPRAGAVATAPRPDRRGGSAPESAA